MLRIGGVVELSASSLAYCVVLFGHQKGRLNRAALFGWVSVDRWRLAAPLVGDKFRWGALVRGWVRCGYGGSPGPVLGLDFLPCGTSRWVGQASSGGREAGLVIQGVGAAPADAAGLIVGHASAGAGGDCRFSHAWRLPMGCQRSLAGGQNRPGGQNRLFDPGS